MCVTRGGWYPRRLHCSKHARCQCLKHGVLGLSFFFVQMVEDYGVNDDITNLLDTFDYYIIPQFNADGYVYTWTQVCYKLELNSV